VPVLSAVNSGERVSTVNNEERPSPDHPDWRVSTVKKPDTSDPRLSRSGIHREQPVSPKPTPVVSPRVSTVNNEEKPSPDHAEWRVSR